ncbi:hypothetical protein [Vampirovibrio chlorellavorus]|uniref:hypothetical protein n=1 Tax=Vampirovibrio chlorellavorus TaxID=758823 RepID=UPI0026F24024|nr:hypothetical protein [Vampirovibrio chlorellavorus]
MYTTPIYGSPSVYSSTSAGRQQGRSGSLHSGNRQDRYDRSSQKKPGFIKRAFNASLKLGGLILGGLALNRYFPAMASKVGAVIPGFIKNPFNQLAGTGIAQKVTGYGNTILTHSESWIGKAKGWISGVLSKQQSA